MTNTLQRCADAAVALRRSHPDVPPIEVLELAFCKVRGSGQVLAPEATHPSTPFGWIIAEAFDWSSPGEWAAWTALSEEFPDLAPTMGRQWAEQVLPRFHLWLAGAAHREDAQPAMRLAL